MNYTPLKVDFLKNNLHMKKGSKIWLLIIVLFIFLTHFIKVAPGKFMDPMASKDHVFAEVKEKLASVKNPYKLHTPQSIVPQVYADTSVTDANTYAVIDYDTGDVLMEKDMSKQVSIASLTKIMTAIVALDLASPDELF